MESPDRRHLFWLITPVALACIVVAALFSGCTFLRGKPKFVAPPTIDAAAALRADAAELGIPIRLPRLPEAWRATAARRETISEGRYIPPPGGGFKQAALSIVDFLAPSGTRGADGAGAGQALHGAQPC